ncbi:MAG: hypothetical protein JO033_07825 [Acidobacteriaceae bacterium]|nr:hypothetical protein [Deltaproteobacteria bacterium]MBV8808566.1 hypothetical protein [Acidobacteriaceae bacterium]
MVQKVVVGLFSLFTPVVLAMVVLLHFEYRTPGYWGIVITLGLMVQATVDQIRGIATKPFVIIGAGLALSVSLAMVAMAE